MQPRWIHLPHSVADRLRRPLGHRHVRKCVRCKEMIYQALLRPDVIMAQNTLRAVNLHMTRRVRWPTCGIRRCIHHERIDVQLARAIMRIEGIRYDRMWWWDVVVPLALPPELELPGYDRSLEFLAPASMILWFRPDHAMAHIEPYIPRLDDPCPEPDRVAWLGALIDRFLPAYDPWARGAAADVIGLARLDAQVEAAG